MLKAIPDHSPFIASELICAGCGNVLKPNPIKNKRGQVEELEYGCRNPESGCSYKIRTNAMTNAEMKGIRSDGTEVKL